jgi:cytochrome c2
MVLWTQFAIAADSPSSVVVPGHARGFAKATANDAAAGRVLLTELNCVLCHQPTNAAALKAKQAPLLESVGGRVQVKWLQKFLSSPHGTKAGTTMPDLFAGLPAKQREESVTALTHFLATTGAAGKGRADAAGVHRGQMLFHQVGCVACHDAQTDDAKPMVGSVPLPVIHEKYSMPGFRAFIKDPLKYRPGGRMPHMNLDDKKANDLTSFFFKDVELIANVNFKYYEGSWSNVPNFNEMKPKLTGRAGGFDLHAAPRKNSFGMQFTGFIQIPNDGKYRFFLGSDDGSKMRIDGKEVVSVDGVHPYQEKNAEIELNKGPHTVTVDYFQGGGEWVLKVDYQGPGISRQGLDTITTLTKEIPKPKVKDGDTFTFSQELAKKGRAVFETAGCASCHSLKLGGKEVASSLKAKPLAELVGVTAGCLSKTPVKNVPHYALSENQRGQLAAAIKTEKSAGELDADQVVHETFARFNCYACHERGKIGGPVAARNSFFATTMKEMGDEGRLPPPLDGVGDKLTENWLKQILGNGSNDRPYMLTAMPKFGTENVGHLTNAFRKVDLKEEAKIADIGIPTGRAKSAGRKLAGDKGLGCIKCHTFGPHKATGIQSIDLTIMTKRLRKDWFHRYMASPQRYRPGTRMPAPWPFGNASIKDVLDGSAPRQMHAVWNYLEDGGNAGIPLGLSKGAIVLTAKDEPVIYRNFIDGVSPRAIAVGYPEFVNICFDAQNFNLALIWQNDFIDASKHWNGRGQGNQRPLGDNVLSLVRGVPFAHLKTGDEKWPSGDAAELGYKFRGYHFNKKRQPSFIYQYYNLSVNDFCEPQVIGDIDGIKRTVSVSSKSLTQATLQYRAASANSIKQLDDGWYQIDNNLKIHIEGGTPEIRKSENKDELIITIDMATRRGQVVQQYAW